jgi:hypothetical protein
VASALMLALLFWQSSALGYHTKEQRLTDDTADTLEGRMWRVGLSKLEYTPVTSFMAGTYPLPWLLRVPNLHLKWRYYKGTKLSLSARLGYFGFDTKNLDTLDEQKTHAVLSVIPFDVAGTWRIDKRASLSLDVIWTGVFIKGEADQEALNGTFQGGATNLQTLGTFELRLSRVTALLLQPRLLSYQLLNLQGDVVLHPDEFTTIEIHGAQQSDAVNFRGAYSLTLSALFSWKLVNLRLGIGYGNYNIPGINFMLPQKSLFPDFDFYLVF